MATGKFQGGVTRVRAGGDEGGAIDLVESQGLFGVEVGEVDGFGDFRVGLVERLAGFGDHDLDEHDRGVLRVRPRLRAGFERVRRH